MNINFASNATGYADRIHVPEGTTIEQLFNDRVGGNPKDYLIRVNGVQVNAEAALASDDSVQITSALKDGDRVTVTPTKIEGGR